MECKYISKEDYKDILSVEVAPYWNVNKDGSFYDSKTNTVEVAPYWNVNRISSISKLSSPYVEVAPYWNVNYVL